MSSTPVRARRATAKVVNYAKEQEFSDASFGDSDRDEDAAPAKRTKRAPTRKAATTETTGAVDHDGDLYHQRPIYTEKGYDPSLPPLRERFPFLPEYEEDGSPKIELIVGRRPIDEKEDAVEEDGDEEDEALEKEDDEEDPSKSTRRKSRSAAKKAELTPPAKKKRGAGGGDSGSKKKKGDASPAAGDAIVEYEYLIKYKGKSYLHLDWKTGADLESMNRSAKGIYRRYLKKLALGIDEELESPEFDPSYIVPEKVLDEADQEVSIDLTDKELVKWEKERDKELAEQGDDEDDEDDRKSPKKPPQNGVTNNVFAEEKKGMSSVQMSYCYASESPFFVLTFYVCSLFCRCRTLGRESR